MNARLESIPGSEAFSAVRTAFDAARRGAAASIAERRKASPDFAQRLLQADIAKGRQAAIWLGSGRTLQDAGRAFGLRPAEMRACVWLADADEEGRFGVDADAPLLTREQCEMIVGIRTVMDEDECAPCGQCGAPTVPHRNGGPGSKCLQCGHEQAVIVIPAGALADGWRNLAPRDYWLDTEKGAALRAGQG